MPNSCVGENRCWRLHFEMFIFVAFGYKIAANDGCLAEAAQTYASEMDLDTL